MKTKTILAVDDVELNLEILHSLLDDYNVIKTTCGFTALKIVDEKQIDLIILDIMMPDIDGFEVCQELKQNPRTKKIPILFITANTDEDSIEKAYEIGGNDYITKPFKTKELLARVAMQIDLVDKTENLENLISTQVEQIRSKDSLLIEQSKKAEMGQMIATIAHQLKQPLNVINAIVSGAQLTLMLGDEVDMDEMSNKVQEEVKFMSETIDMYRTFFSSSKEKKLASLEKTIETTLDIIGANTLSVHLVKDYKNDLGFIKIYSNEIIQCVMNLIKNAQDHLNEMKIKKKVIKISTDENKKYQIITVHDNGGGVPEEIQEKIFENYFTTKCEDKGTGIGLHLVKQIIEDKHNGKVYVKNEILEYEDISEMGAKFVIKLRKSD
ncbi:MAG: hybrid sensor histidine kinase/response regulator [Campylobacterota bacterium]|nr:hybrid sensor histidine kinase/response regulator [Campylobacterota bacterium]